MWFLNRQIPVLELMYDRETASPGGTSPVEVKPAAVADRYQAGEAKTQGKPILYLFQGNVNGEAR